MSSAATKGAAASDKQESKTAQLDIQAVSAFDSPLAKGFALGRPAILLAALASGMSYLVADPTWALWISLPALSLLQMGYVITTLPAAGSVAVAKARPGEKKKKNADPTRPFFVSLFSLVMSLVATPAFYILFVLFGAPFFNNTLSTLLCAVHLILLGFFPVFYVRGLHKESFLAIAGATAPLDETYGALLGAVLGAWLGAIPIPLDWDRDWQRWPVTIVVGMYAGSCVGSLVCGTLLHGKRLASPSTEDEKEE